MFEFTTLGETRLAKLADALGIAPQRESESFDTFLARVRASVREEPERACALVEAAIRDLVWEIDQPTAS